MKHFNHFISGFVVAVTLLAFAYANADTLGGINVTQGGTGLTAAPQGNVLIGNSALHMSATSTLFISSGSNVGIGTTTPSAPLTVQGTASGVNPIFKVTDGTHSSGFYVSTTQPIIQWGSISNDDVCIFTNNATCTFTVKAGAPGSVLTINSSGNVGIGTTSPSQALSVTGNEYLTGFLGIGTNAQTPASEKLAVKNSLTTGSFLMSFFNGNNEGVYFGHTGSTANYNSYGFPTQTVFMSSDWTATPGAYRPLGFATGGVGRMLLDTNGNLGIGTTSPYGQLSVQTGSASTRGLIIKESASQTANPFEIYDSSGNNLGSINNDFSVINASTSIAIGAGAHLTLGLNAVALGNGSQANGSGCTSLGNNAVCNGINAAAFGIQANAGGTRSYALGPFANASNGETVAIGDSTKAQGAGSIAIGNQSSAGFGSDFAIGTVASTTMAGEFVFASGFSNPSFNLQSYDDSFVSGIDLGGLSGSWISNTHASRKARVSLNVYDTVVREGIRLDATGSGVTTQFLGGNVGIATTTPNVPLDVLGTENSGGTNVLTLDTTAKAFSAGGPLLNFAQGQQTTAALYSSTGSGNNNPFLAFQVSPNTTTPVEVGRFDKSGNFGIGTTTATANFQVTTSSANATTSAQFGKANQNKGSCITYYDTAGSPVYMFFAAGATSPTYQNGGTAPSGCKN